MRRLLPLAALLAVMGCLGTARAARAYSGCWGSGPHVTDATGSHWSTRYCHAYHRGPMFGGFTARGYSLFSVRYDAFLNAGNSWFVCQQKTIVPNPKVGGARNDWWLYTMGDYAIEHRGWGWFPATYVSGGRNWSPIPGLRACGYHRVLYDGDY